MEQRSTIAKDLETDAEEENGKRRLWPLYHHMLLGSIRFSIVGNRVLDKMDL